MPYRDAWVRRSQQQVNVDLVAPIDPQHLQPAEDEDHPGQPAPWQSNAPAPDLPGELLPTGEVQGSVGFGPIDHTPADPSFGVGGGPGLTTLESQEIRGDLMSNDMGAYAAHRYIAAVDRDGAPHVAIINDTPGDGDSPQTLQLKRTGVGQPNDPDARVGRRIKRWYDRHIDMHRYVVEMRPKYLRYATTVNTQDAVPGGNQLTSPYPAFVGRVGTPDSFVGPQDRRTPAPWDQASTVDGTETQASSFGLGSWGL